MARVVNVNPAMCLLLVPQISVPPMPRNIPVPLVVQPLTLLR